MAKRKRRQAFPTVEDETYTTSDPHAFVERPRGVFGFMRDHGVRETVESVIVAIILALMFRAYEAEAFIIPTGSMAPSLQGQHMDVVCDQCSYQYRAGASASASNIAPESRQIVTKTFCPVCRYGMTMQLSNADHRSNNGDRILVNKFVYDFQDPSRYDVIVFKNPNNGKQNYIKRLIGLPGDRLLIDHGDIYDVAGSGQRQIQRKPEHKVDVMLHLVDDTHHIATQLKRAGWPSRWSEWASPEANWKVNSDSDKPHYEIGANSGGPHWLRYRHLAPKTAHDELLYDQAYKNRRVDGESQLTDWELVEKREIPERIKNSETGEIGLGSLIRDHYEYNDRRYRARQPQSPEHFKFNLSAASHWVGDLAMDCELEVNSDAGQLLFDLVEGGVHFICTIDLSTGQAELTTKGDNGNVQFENEGGGNPTASTPMKGRGKYKIRYAQLDDMIYLWINNKYVPFDGSGYVLKDGKRPVPKYDPTDAGDSEPLGVGSIGAEIRVDRLKVHRDVYYVAPVTTDFRGTNIRNETGIPDVLLSFVYDVPLKWDGAQGQKVFLRDREDGPIFELAAGQYFPMGDNSPASLDARVWGGPKFVDEEYMIGRAMCIYWPHSLNRPVKFFPNFKRMGFIR